MTESQPNASQPVSTDSDRETLRDKTVYFLGKLAAFSRKDASDIVRCLGGKVARQLNPSVRIVVVGEGDVLSTDWNLWNDQLDAATREAFEAGRLEIVAEALFWQRYGETVEGPAASDRPQQTLYTPSMLAELVGLPISLIRRLQRQRLIVPVRQTHRLAYFDFEALVPLKIVRGMLEAGLSVAKALERLQKVKRNRSDLPSELHLRGRDILFVTKEGPIDQDGQRRFDFMLDPAPIPEPPTFLRPDPLAVLDSIFRKQPEPDDVPALCEAASQLESDGRLREALDLYRAALSAGGPDPQINFQVAELLYRLGELPAARERYFMAIEQDDEFVEARANLGCVLAELGCDDLAASAFRGALKYHPEYAEVRFHLGMLLYRIGLSDEAAEHLQWFFQLTPDSPWIERIPAELLEQIQVLPEPAGYACQE